MNLGNRIRGRHLAAGRRKGLFVPSAHMAGYVLSRHGRSLSALRPLSLIFMRQAAVGGQQAGAHHFHIHQQFLLRWQSRLAQFSQMAAGVGARAGRADAGGRLVSRPQRAEWKDTAAVRLFPAIQPSSVEREIVRKPAVPDLPAVAPTREVLRPLHLQTRGIRSLESWAAGLTESRAAAEGKAMLHPLLPGTLPNVIRRAAGAVSGATAQLMVMKQTMATTGGRGDIRLLRASLLERDGASATAIAGARTAASSTPPEPVNTTLASTKTRHEAVSMVVKQETSNPMSGDVLGQGTPSNPLVGHPAPLLAKEGIKGKWLPTDGGVTATAAQAIQPKIDVNRLTDEVYRMLKRRLITERERRGR